MAQEAHPTCLDLDPAEHRALQWLTRRSKAGQRPVPLAREILITDLDRWLRTPRGADALTHLEDGGYVQQEESGWSVVVWCTCEISSGVSSPDSGGGAATQSRVPRSGDLRKRTSVFGVAGIEVELGRSRNLYSVPPNTRSIRPHTRSMVPKLVDQFVEMNGGKMIPGQMNRAALGQNIKKWLDEGITVSTVQEMITEFDRHPEWSRRSRRAPWQVFITKRQDLINLVAAQQRKDPSNRRYAATRDWHGRFGPPVNAV